MTARGVLAGAALALLRIVAPAACAAAEPAPPSTFTVSGYVQAALDSAPEVRQAAALFESARAAWKSQAASAWMPTLGFTGLATPYGHDPAEGYRFEHWLLARADTSLDTSINLNLFNGFSDYFKTRQASLSRDSAQASLSAARQARAFAAAQAFYDLGLRDRLLEVAEQSLHIYKDGYDLTMDLYHNGMKSLADQLKSETDWHSSELNQAQAGAARKQSLLQFNLLIGRAPDQTAALAAELDPGAAALPNLDADEQSALSARPEMISARLAVETNDVAAAQALRNGVPQFSLNASYNRLDNGFNIGTGGVPSPNYQLGLSLALPLGFNGASQWLNVSAARSQAAAARQSLAAVARQVRSDVHTAYIALEVALASYRIATITEDIAQRNLDLVTEQYKQGSATADVIRLSQAQLDYLNARTARVQALFGALVSRYQYRLAIGEPLWK